MRAYLGRVTKARILGAVAEGKGQRAADRIEHLKKGEMAAEAEALLADAGWLPEPLRTPGHPEPQAGEATAEPAGEETAENDGETAVGEEDGIADNGRTEDAPRTLAAE